MGRGSVDNSGYHNLFHVCEAAEMLWETARIPIGRFSEQGGEALNKDLKFWLEERTNNNRSTQLSTNMFFLALNNIWRDMFQPDFAGTKKIRARGQCSACLDCDSGKQRCATYPACKDAEVKLPHFRRGARCWHCDNYKVIYKYEDLVANLDDELLQSLI